MGSEQHPARWSGKRSVRAYDQASAAETTVVAPVEVELEPEPEAAPEPEQEQQAAPEQEEEPSTQQDEGPLATDAARQLAFQHGVDLNDVTGTGAEGRITRDDVAAFVSASE